MNGIENNLKWVIPPGGVPVRIPTYGEMWGGYEPPKPNGRYSTTAKIASVSGIGTTLFAPYATVHAQETPRELVAATATPATVAEAPEGQETIPFPLYTQELGQLDIPTINFANPTQDDLKKASDFLASLSNSEPFSTIMRLHQEAVEGLAQQEGKNPKDYSIKTFFDDSTASIQVAAMILREKQDGQGFDRAYFYNEEKEVFEFIELQEGEQPGVFRYTDQDDFIYLVPGVLTQDGNGNPIYLIFGWNGGELFTGRGVEPTKSFSEVAMAPEASPLLTDQAAVDNWFTNAEAMAERLDSSPYHEIRVWEPGTQPILFLANKQTTMADNHTFILDSFELNPDYTVDGPDGEKLNASQAFAFAVRQAMEVGADETGMVNNIYGLTKDPKTGEWKADIFSVRKDAPVIFRFVSNIMEQKGVISFGGNGKWRYQLGEDGSLIINLANVYDTGELTGPYGMPPDEMNAEYILYLVDYSLMRLAPDADLAGHTGALYTNYEDEAREKGIQAWYTLYYIPDKPEKGLKTNNANDGRGGADPINNSLMLTSRVS